MRFVIHYFVLILFNSYRLSSSSIALLCWALSPDVILSAMCVRRCRSRISLLSDANDFCIARLWVKTSMQYASSVICLSSPRICPNMIFVRCRARRLMSAVSIK